MHKEPTEEELRKASRNNKSRLEIGTLAQKCTCCGAGLKLIPFIRLDRIVRGIYGYASANLCYDCIKVFANDLAKAFKDENIMKKLFTYKLNDK